MRVQKIYIKFMAKGDPSSGLFYKFPVNTLNIFVKDNVIVDKEFVNWLSDYANTGGFNIYLTKDNLKLSSCCRLVNDHKELMKHNVDSFGNGGGSGSIGSHRVVTLNLFNIKKSGYDLDYYADLAMKGLKAHRELLRDLIDKGFLRFFQPMDGFKFFDLDRMFFSTLGFIGLYETCKGKIDDMEKLIIKLRDLSFKMAEKYSVPVNVEQIPAESAAYKLADGEEHQILSNQYLPLWEDYDILDRIEVAGRLDSLITGGSITHLNIGSKLSKEQFLKLINLCAEKGVNHFALNPVFSICDKEHTTMTKVDKCPICNSENIEYYTRIVGYFSKVKSSWSPKRQELDFPNRKWLEFDKEKVKT
jgi:ribonucleoside-triphosphate reductase